VQIADGRQAFCLDFSGLMCKLGSESNQSGRALAEYLISVDTRTIMDDLQTRRAWLVTTVTAAGGAFVAGSMTSRAWGQGTKTIGVRVVDKEGYDKIIAANKGKVIVVDCWATWCVPCRKAFPKTVELSKTYADQGVVVISLCFDDPVKGQAPESVKRFLALNDAHFENLISSLDISADGADTFSIPEGALPHFKVYGKDGKLFKAFESGEDKEFKHEDIEAAVKSALKARHKS
jgi:thiol-disulfide isomerase/thioredoxin